MLLQRSVLLAPITLVQDMVQWHESAVLNMLLLSMVSQWRLPQANMAMHSLLYIKTASHNSQVSTSPRSTSRSLVHQ